MFSNKWRDGEEIDMRVEMIIIFSEYTNVVIKFEYHKQNLLSHLDYELILFMVALIYIHWNTVYIVMYISHEIYF